jgi:hypothetical protein
MNIKNQLSCEAYDVKSMRALVLTSTAKKADPKPGDTRYLISGVKLTCISYGENYVTARVAACYPTVYSLKAWEQLLK